MNDLNLDFFNNRHTVRKFSDREIPTETLNAIIEAAAHAPNTGNMQQYSVIVTRSPEGIKALAPAHFNQPAATGCKAILTFCLDFNRFEHWCRISNAQPGYRNFQAFTWGVIDTTIFAQQFCTIAEMHGLGCCYLGTTTYNAPLIAQILALPHRVVPVVSLAIGYPDGDATISDRLPLNAIAHNEVYRDYSDNDILQAYSEKESLEESKKYVSENSKDTLAQVFTDIRYPRSTNEEFSHLFLDFIVGNGFNIPF